MKNLNVLILSALLTMSFGAFAEGTHSDHATTHNESHKEMKKGRMAKGKKTKPLTAEEKKELSNMRQTSTPPEGTAPEKEEVK